MQPELGTSAAALLATFLIAGAASAHALSGPFRVTTAVEHGCRAPCETYGEVGTHYGSGCLLLCSTAASEQPQQVTVQTGKWLTENVKSVCVQNAFVKRRKRAARAKAKQVRLAMWKFSQDFLAAYIDATKPDPSLSRVVKSKYCRAPASVRRPLGNHKSLSQRWLPFSPQAEVNLLQKHICEHPELLEYVKRLEHLQNLFLNLNPDGTIPSKPSGCS